MSVGRMRLLAFALTVSVGVVSAGNSEERITQGRLVGSERKGHSLDVTLSSGLHIRHVVYRKEPLGGRWLLQIKRKTGLSMSREHQRSIRTLTEQESLELMSKLLEIVKNQHGGRLDSIQLDLAVLEYLGSDVVRQLRAAPIASNQTITPKLDAIRTSVQDSLNESTLVIETCRQVELINMSCGKSPVSMNPIPFQKAYVGKPWGDVKRLPNAGIDMASTWFSIDLQ